MEAGDAEIKTLRRVPENIFVPKGSVVGLMLDKVD